MEKKLTLEQAWKYCLAMWKWIAKQIKKGSDSHVETLKAKWLKKHPQFGEVYNDCFFCEYLSQSCTTKCGDCLTCPGKLVDKGFNCMDNKSYHFFDKPLKFYQKLPELNKKRKSK